MCIIEATMHCCRSWRHISTGKYRVLIIQYSISNTPILCFVFFIGIYLSADIHYLHQSASNEMSFFTLPTSANEPVCVKQRKSKYVAWAREIIEELRSYTFARLPGNSLDNHDACYSTSMWMGWCNLHLYHHSHSLEYMSLQWRSQPGPASCSTAWQSVSICLSSRYAELSMPRRTTTVMLFLLIVFTSGHSKERLPKHRRSCQSACIQQEDKAAHFGFSLQNLV